MPTRPRPRASRPPYRGFGPGLGGLALLGTLQVARLAVAAPTEPTEPAAPATTAAPAEPAPAEPTPTEPATADLPVAAAAVAPASVPVRPPRVDGPYLGLTLGASASLARVNNFTTPNPLLGSAAGLRFGEAILPWMTIGVELAGTWGYRFADPRQRLLQGAFLIDFGFLPSRKLPLSLHVGFGAGGGAVRQADRSARSGFGGAVFTGSVRYEIFPLADRKRPNRGGGFSLGPELGWLGFTPAARGRPMSNTFYLGLFVGFYFGS